MKVCWKIRCRRKLSQTYNRIFYKELSPEGKKAYHAYQEHETKLNQITDIDTFIRGVRFGVRLMMDVVGDYTSPLPQRNEMEAAE